jgi:endonuclease G
LATATAAMTAEPTKPEGKWGFPSTAVFKHGYARAEFTRWGAAWWCEHLSMRRLSGERSKRRDAFKTDETLPKPLRWTETDFAGSGFDLGHQVPAADCAWSDAAMADSFLMTNVMPQTPTLNETHWRALEDHVRALVVDGRTEVWCFTGGLWEVDAEGKLEIQTIGAHEVPVPHSCWKTVLVTRDGDVQAMAAWVMPNVDHPPKFVECGLSVRALEEAARLDFWSGVPDDLEHSLETKKP